MTKAAEMLDIKGRIKSLGEILEIFQTIFLSLDSSLTEMIYNFFTLATQLEKLMNYLCGILGKNHNR